MDERVDPTTIPHKPPPVSRELPARQRLPLGKIALAVVLCGAAAAAGWYWWTHHDAKPAASTAATGRAGQGAPQPVGAATIDTGDIRVILSELGTVTPLANVTVKTQISGQLQEVGFQEGQHVKKGDFLAQIDPRPYQVSLDQAQGTLAHDQGLLQQAQTNFKRFQTLGKQDSIAQQQVDDQRYLVAQYTGTVQSDQAQVDSAKLNLVYCHIISPVDGQVGLRQVDAGNYVQASDASGLVMITQMTPITVIFSVPEDALPDILSQLHAAAKLQVQAYDRANTHLLATGELSTLDNLIDTTTGTLKLRASFANEGGQLYPNQFVNARLLVSTLHNTLLIPSAAVQRNGVQAFVYKVNSNGTASIQNIVEKTSDGNISAVEGLNPGDTVSLTGFDKLQDGTKVSIESPQADVTGNGEAAGTLAGKRADGPTR